MSRSTRSKARRSAFEITSGSAAQRVVHMPSAAAGMRGPRKTAVEHSGTQGFVCANREVQMRQGRWVRVETR
jgi:hypothetical protein